MDNCLQFRYKMELKSNVLGKIIVPRLNETTHYINSELEEREREEVFRLKRVKQKKEHERQLERAKYLGLVDEKDAPTKPDKRDGSSPTTKSKSPGDSKTVVNRPPETVNLLILNPRDEPDPTSVSSTFIPAFGGKVIPGILQAEELFDEKNQSGVESNLNTTEDANREDRSTEAGVSKENIIDVQKLNEPARNLVQEITKDGIRNIDESKNREIQNTSKITDNTISITLSDTINERILKPASENTEGYIADLDESKSDIKKEQQSNKLHTKLPVQSIVTKSDSIKTIDKMDDEDQSTSDTDEQKSVKNVIGNINLMPKMTTSSNVGSETDSSQIIHSAAQVDITQNDHIEGEHQLNMPAKVLLSEVVKGIISNEDERKTKKVMKDAETIHENSVVSTATQYEYVEETADEENRIILERKDEIRKESVDVLEAKNISERNATKDKTEHIKQATSSKQLKIQDSDISVRDGTDMTEKDNNDSENDKSNNSAKKKRRKRKKKENLQNENSDNGPSVD